MEAQSFKVFFEKSPTAYACVKVLFDQEGLPCDYVYLAINKAYSEMMQFKTKAVVNKRFYEVFPNGWEGESQWLDALHEAVLGRENTEFDIYRSGLQKWVRVMVFPMQEEDTFAFIHYDVTKEYMLDNEIEGFLKVNIDMFCVADTSGNFLKVNQAFERILGYREEELEGKSFISLIHVEDVPSTIAIMKDLVEQRAVASYVNRVRGKDGLFRYLEWHSQPNGKYIYATARDITVARQLEIELSQNNESLLKLTETLQEKNKVLKTLAVTDELTGLYNRHFLDQRIEGEMKHSDDEDQPLSMIILDLDHFKSVNDTWGHPVGDQVLKEIAELTNRIIRQSDFLVRFGGEEFVVVMPNSSMDAAITMAEKIRTTMEAFEFPIVGHLTSSFGVAERQKFESFYSWYKRADKALYRAKQGGRNCVKYSNDDPRNFQNAPAFFEWKSGWESGNQTIDLHHQELVQQANSLIRMSLTNVEKEMLIEKADSILYNIREHFQEEEQILQDKGYPDYAKHTEIHDRLMSKAYQLRDSFENGDIKLSELFSFIVDEVIISHTIHSDMEFFSYIKHSD